MVISCRGKFITIPSNAKMNVIDDDIGKIAFQLIYIANDKGIKYMDWKEFEINTLFLKDVVSEYQDLIENL